MSRNPIAIPELSNWKTSNEYREDNLNLTVEKFLEVTNLLLENPNHNSSHLFRADILFDSDGILKTTAEKEQECCDIHSSTHVGNGVYITDGIERQRMIQGHNPDRTIVRRLIPRNTIRDRPLEQVCQIYELSETSWIVVLIPIVQNEAEIPWYHPTVKALAYCYACTEPVSPSIRPPASLSLHFLPFSDLDPVPDRLYRTFISLLNIFIRLSKQSSTAHQDSRDYSRSLPSSTAPSLIKDTILPQHLVQDTYSRLKQTYAATLINKWVESTEPSKHVFEDLSIAAFLIELWKQMYHSQPFPGFVDIACGNGVLVHILLKEGYSGFGFDARRRKTWDILGIDEHLEERICIPQPFLDALEQSDSNASNISDIKIHNGIFQKGTFIISNHADELTPWTPLLAAVSCPTYPLPWLAIPCCSHSLSGAKHRFTLKEIKHSSVPTTISPHEEKVEGREDEQPSTGDLRALRAAKAKAATHSDDKSMYACLTKKVISLAEQVGYSGDVQMTLMRIPSTRNIGIVGGRKMVRQDESSFPLTLRNDAEIGHVSDRTHGLSVEENSGEIGRGAEVLENAHRVIARECASSGGIAAAARTWAERARMLQAGKGRGKVNLGHKPESSSS